PPMAPKPPHALVSSWSTPEITCARQRRNFAFNLKHRSMTPMMKMKLLPLAICLASAPVFALEQGEYRLNYFGSVGITHLGGEDQGRSYGVSGQTTDSWRGDQLSKFGAQLTYG